MQRYPDALAEPAVDWSQRVVPQVQALTAYQPGITEEKLRRDTGLPEIFKYSSNEAPFSPSPAVETAMREALKRGNRYPDGQALLDSLSERLAVPVNTITIGNGSIDIIASL